MGNVEMHDLSPARDVDRTELNLSRNVNHKQFTKHLQGDLNESCLLEIPWSVRDAVSLYERMNVSFNYIQEIPVELPLRLPHLNHLDISYNQLASLPESFGLLFHLKTVLLNNNQIKLLPQSFLHLVKLEKVDLSYNNIRHLPEDIGKMESLARINVSNNVLKELPVSLGASAAIQIILAKHNKLGKAVQSICDEGSESTLKYLRKQHLATGSPTSNTKVNVFPRMRGNQLQFSVQNSQSALAEYIQTQTNTTNTPSRIKTPLLPPLGASELDVNDLRDRILGMVYGAAIGDGIGIATENMKPDECRFYYDPNTLTYSDIIRDGHRVRWQKGDWTIDFDQMAIVLESLINWAGVVDELDFAKRLHDWSNTGFKELGDKGGFVVSNTITKVVNNPDYLTAPHSIARNLMEGIVQEEPDAFVDNGAIVRCLLLGVPTFHDINEVKNNAVRICKATHVDSRCLASGVMVSTMVALMLQGRHDLEDPESIDDLIECAKNEGSQLLEESCGEHMEEFEAHVRCRDNESVKVHEWGKMSHTFKPMAAGVAALRSRKDFRSSIVELVMLGADANCNACVAGALVGCKYGYAQLPKDWVDGLREQQVDWLNSRLNMLLDMMGIP